MLFLEKHKNSPSKYSHSSLISPSKRDNFESLSRHAFQTSKHGMKALKMMYENSYLNTITIERKFKFIETVTLFNYYFFIMTAIQFHEKILSIQQNMFNFAMLLTANRFDAEDLQQETTLRVLDNRDKYVDNINFKGWVLTIMRNIFINNYRKDLRSQTIIDQTDDLYHLNVPENSKCESPEDIMNAKEIEFIINGLNSNLKIPFLLYLDGYKYHEISDELKLPLGTVKSRIFFARQELQRNLTGVLPSN